MVHRGPDDSGHLFVNSSSGANLLTQSDHCKFEPDLLLASRRLSITDIDGRARQPMANHDQTIFVVFNGALHNHAQLRNQLVSAGYQFRTNSDTEVLVHSYEHWGEDCVKRFNGMWAFALWDQRKKALFLSRDRFAIKPLYISESDGILYFGSEIKALVASKKIAIKENRHFIEQTFLRGVHREDSNTAFAGIHELPAAHNLIITKEKTRQYRYWQYTDFSCNYDFSKPENTFLELLENAVDIRLQADVPQAILLSGGMDSSAMAVLATRSTGVNLPAYCARFKGSQYDESHYAALVAGCSGVPLTFVDYEPTDLTGDLEKLTWHLERPAILGQMLARWHLLQAVGKEAKIVLEGQGADELMGGYSKYLAPYFRDEIKNLNLRGCPTLFLLCIDAALHRPSSRFIAAMFKNRVRRVAGLEKSGIFSPKKLLSGAMLTASETTGERFPSSELFNDPLNQALWRDHAKILLPNLLHFGDAISMAHSVESRLPFLDHRLVEFVFALPARYKMQGSRSKMILRNALRETLPKEILARRKKFGFSTPVDKWVRDNLNNEIKPRLLSSQVAQRGLFDMQTLKKLIENCETSGTGSFWLYRCLATEIWYQTFMDV